MKLKKGNYIRFQYHDRLANSLLMVTWMSLTAFIIVAKSKLGISNMPIFEVLIFLTSLIGVKIVYKLKNINYSLMVLINNITEGLFVISLSYILYKYDIKYSGVVVYMVIIINSFTSYFENEAKQNIEHMELTNKRYKKYLKDIRRFSSMLQLVSGIIGSSLALIFLTYFKVNLITFTRIMLILNFISVIYSLYIWNKYLR